MHSAGVNSEAPSAPPLRGSSHFVLRLLAWLVLYGVALGAYNLFYTKVSPVLVHALQVQPSARVIKWTREDRAVIASGNTIRTPEVQVEIARGCDGVEGWLILATALLVFPLPASSRLSGLLLGSALMFALNLLRIVSLYEIGLHRPGWFDIAHGLVWQTMMTLAAGGFALYWMSPRITSKTSPAR